MPQLLFLEIYCQSIHWVDDLWIVSVVEIQRIKCVGIGIQKKILSLTLLMPTIISDHLMGRQCRLIPIFNGCRMLGFFLGLFLELDRKYRKQIYKVSYISRNISGIISAWGNMGLARFWEMAYIPQFKVPSASSSGSLSFIVCLKCCRMVDSVPIRHTISILWMIPPLGWKCSHGRTQYIPGKQVLVSAWL